MNAVERQLRDGLDGLDRALEAFGDPTVEEVPGLRLMRDAVRRKRDDMVGKLAEAEACRLDVIVGGGAVDHGGIDPAFLAALVPAVIDAVDATAAALAPDAPRDQRTLATELRVEGVPPDGPGVRLRAAPADVRGALRARRTPLVEVVLREIVAAAGSADDDRLAAVRELRDRSAATVRFAFRPPFADPRTADLA